MPDPVKSVRASPISKNKFDQSKGSLVMTTYKLDNSFKNSKMDPLNSSFFTNPDKRRQVDIENNYRSGSVPRFMNKRPSHARNLHKITYCAVDSDTEDRGVAEPMKGVALLKDNLKSRERGRNFADGLDYYDSDPHTHIIEV